MPTLSSRTPSLFEMQTMGYGFRGAHVGCPHGVTTTPRLASSKGAVDAATSEYRVEVPPCPSPRIQTQDCSIPISSGAAPRSTSTNVQNSLPQVDDQVQVSYYCAYQSGLLRIMLTLFYDRLMAQLFVE